MLHLAKEDYSINCRYGIWYITGNNEARCPVCDGELRVHGICHRKMRTFKRTLTLRLRVLICKKCGKTHRELPHFLIPYKRYCLRCVAEILMDSGETYPCESSTRMRMRKWWIAFSTRIESILLRSRRHDYHPQDQNGVLTAKLLRYVRWSVKLSL